MSRHLLAHEPASSPDLVAMWCSHCQQDVPGIASTDEFVGICCARCGRQVGASAEEAVADTDRSTPTTVADGEREVEEMVSWSDQYDGVYWKTHPPIDWHEQWQWDDDMWSVQRITDSAAVTTPAHFPAKSTTSELLNETRQAVDHWHDQLVHPQGAVNRANSSLPKHSGRGRRRPLLSWFMLSSGLTVFVCGAGLLVGGYVTGRTDLWNLGIPVSVVGQIALLIGLVLQLDGLWRSNRSTADTLGALDNRLQDLKQTTAMMGTTHSSAAQSFYAHMAEGANPQLMLADLKGQLDMLAMKMAKKDQ